MKIFWHRRDLRIESNKALKEAFSAGDKVLPIFIYDEEPLGSASDWWLHHALEDLSSLYHKNGVNLYIARGRAEKILTDFIKDHNVDAIYCNYVFEPKVFQRDKALFSKLHKSGIDIHLYNENYLIDPRDVMNKTEKPYSVYTPFYNAAMKVYHHEKVHKEIDFNSHISLKGLKVSELNLIDGWPWMKKLEKHWDPTRKGAMNLINFFKTVSLNYKVDRDFPAIEGTSKLSPYLHFGQVSPRELYEKFSDVEFYVRELAWREFANYFLFHFKEIENENWNKKFDRFEWSHSIENLEIWKKGMTGYPIVDAGMRQLWQTGWMHNRIRMVVGSFLTKDLLIDWRDGAKHFIETLVDADLASNCMNWQWVSGSGPDAAPYFRVFNPTLQSEKFDKAGDYIRKFVPELKKLSSKWIHAPWLAPPEALKAANITLGKDYPYPIVDHSEARDKALAIFNALA
jgi:deoxyribodipyrimidine photo-lyase